MSWNRFLRVVLAASYHLNLSSKTLLLDHTCSLVLVSPWDLLWLLWCSADNCPQIQYGKLTGISSSGKALSRIKNNGRETRSAKPIHRTISSFVIIIGYHYIYRGKRTYFYHGLLEAG
mmetsp:Transcript_15499/g.24087  ORF Transcript_15499/g.24087 Transcript_15499/m.24087 type:complete len:118 (+) Transcript_15499:207-560(+)